LANEKEKIEDLKKFLDIYLGEYKVKLSKSDLDLFKKLTLAPNMSYIVVHPLYEMLRKFTQYFLTLREVSYLSYTIDIFLREYKTNNYEHYYNELLIIKYHANVFEFGRSIDFIRDSLLETITSRNREGLTTIILAEKHIPFLQECPELRYVQLGNSSICNSSYLGSSVIGDGATNSSFNF